MGMPEQLKVPTANEPGGNIFGDNGLSPLAHRRELLRFPIAYGTRRLFFPINWVFYLFRFEPSFLLLVLLATLSLLVGVRLRILLAL